MARTYVITGTSRGIGLELTKQLLEAGQTVLALARSPQSSKPLLSLKEKYSDRLQLSPVDVTSDEQVAAFVRELGSNRPVDVLVNNAGVYGETADFENISLQDISRLMTANAIGPMRMTRALLPNLKKSERPKVIHITSLMGSIADNESGGSYAYRMSKAALNMFHKSFSIDFPEIVSLVIHPGWVKTDMGGANAPTEPQESARGILRVIENASPQESGSFVDFEGDKLPW